MGVTGKPHCLGHHPPLLISPSTLIPTPPPNMVPLRTHHTQILNPNTLEEAQGQGNPRVLRKVQGFEGQAGHASLKKLDVSAKTFTPPAASSVTRGVAAVCMAAGSAVGC